MKFFERPRVKRESKNVILVNSQGQPVEHHRSFSSTMMAWAESNFDKWVHRILVIVLALGIIGLLITLATR